MTSNHPTPSAMLLCVLSMWQSIAWAGAQEWIAEFANSEFEFQRSTTNVPFPPIAFASVTHYGDTNMELPNGKPLGFSQTAISQAAAIPFLIDDDDAVLVGEWLSWNKFDSKTKGQASFEAWSVGLPMAWLRQVDPSWQAAAFAFPMAHKASLPGSEWSYEFMGGAFGRYVQNERLWWGFGFFADVGHGNDYYLPYLGASLTLSDEWTLSGVMPWPAVIYAPDKDRMVRFGVMPSNASWSLNPRQAKIDYDLGGWDMGVSAGYRLTGNVWVQAEAGYSGLRALTINGDGLQEPEFGADGTPFVRIGIEFRPSMLD